MGIVNATVRFIIFAFVLVAAAITFTGPSSIAGKKAKPANIEQTERELDTKITPAIKRKENTSVLASG